MRKTTNFKSDMRINDPNRSRIQAIDTSSSGAFTDCQLSQHFSISNVTSDETVKLFIESPTALLRGPAFVQRL
jgi:hypothetical protein